MRFFLEKQPRRSSYLQMENRLINILYDVAADCVVSEEAVRNLVALLKEKQDDISRQEPRLRRVEISADLLSRYGMIRFINIGQVSIPLKPVRSIIEI